MTGLGRQRAATSPVCTETGCDLPHYAKDLCQTHYRRLRYRSSSNDNGGRSGAQPRPIPAAATCPRCTTQVEALSADAGWGDRIKYFRSLTAAQRAAYVLGYGDGRRGDMNAPAKIAAIMADEPVTWWRGTG